MPNVKVAIAQIHTLLACRYPNVNGGPLNALEVPLAFPYAKDTSEHEIASLSGDWAELLPRLDAFAPSQLAEKKSWSDYYLHCLVGEIGALVAKCRKQKAGLLIFPELSIPFEILEDVKRLSDENGIVVVAGTHQISWKSQSKYYPYAKNLADRFKEIGNDLTDPDDTLEFSICPVFVPGNAEPHLILKQVFSHYEQAYQPDFFDPERKVLEINAQDINGQATLFNLAVVVCSEFILDPQAEPSDFNNIKQQIDHAMDNADLIAVVSHSPSVSPFKDKAQSFLSLRRGGGCMVAYANAAQYGGSFLWRNGDKHPEEEIAAWDEALIFSTIWVGGGAGEARGHRSHDTVFISNRPNAQMSIEKSKQLAREESFEAALVELKGIPCPLPPSLEKNRKDMEIRLQQKKSEISPKSIVCLQTGSSVVEALRLYLMEAINFTDVDVRKWKHVGHAPLHTLLHQKLEQFRSRGLLENDPAESIRGKLPATYVSHIAGGNVADLGSQAVRTKQLVVIRVTSVPHETLGIAHQGRLTSQVLELLSTNEFPLIQRFELRLFGQQAEAKKRVARQEIYLLFTLQKPLVEKDYERVSSQIFNLCDERLITYGLMRMDVASTHFRQYGAHPDDFTANDTNLASKFPETWNITSRKNGNARFAMMGRCEGKGVLRLLSADSGEALLRIIVNHIDGDDHQVSCDVEKPIFMVPQDECGKAAIQARITTNVQDLQDAEGAAQSVSFESPLFSPETDGGEIPRFPVTIQFCVSIRNRRLTAEAIGLELAGPGRFLVSSISIDGNEKLCFELFSDKELFYILKLPFGPLESFAEKDNSLAFRMAELPLRDSGIRLGKVRVRGGRMEDYYWQNELRTRHLYAVGKTGTGKSYFLGSLIAQDIASGGGAMVVDPHGDLIEMVLARIPKHRIEDVRYFDPGDTRFPPAMNLFDFDLADHYQRSLVIEEAIHIFVSLYGAEIFGPRIQQYSRGAMLSLMDYAHSLGPTRRPCLLDVGRIFIDSKFRADVISTVQDDGARLFWDEYKGSGDREKQEMIPYFQAKFGPMLSSRILKNIFGQEKNTIDLGEALAEHRIILVNLSRGRMGDTNADLLGMILIAKLRFEIMKRAQLHSTERPRFTLYVDEFQNLASKSFVSLLSEGRKYGLSLVLANQFLSQLKLYHDFQRGDPDQLFQAVFGNVNTFLAFRSGRSDAELLAKELDIPRDSPFADPATAITQLQQYQAILSASAPGGEVKAALFESERWNGIENPSEGKNISEYAKARYCTSREEVEPILQNRTHR